MAAIANCPPVASQGASACGARPSTCQAMPPRALCISAGVRAPRNRHLQVMNAAMADLPQPDRAVGFVVDETKMIADMGFPISPDELIAKTKYAMEGQKFLTDPEVVDRDNFVFSAPFVGLDWDGFARALGQFNLANAFPDLHQCLYHFRVDPYQPGRVWFTSRSWGVNTGPLFGGPATNKVADAPPQNSSFTFNKDGKIVEMTIGYVQDKRLGNQGGVGGIFGMLYAVGRALPFPEAQPWKMSNRFRLFNLVGTFVQTLEKTFGKK